jgi:hypothetical protein
LIEAWLEDISARAISIWNGAEICAGPCNQSPKGTLETKATEN